MANQTRVCLLFNNVWLRCYKLFYLLLFPTYLLQAYGCVGSEGQVVLFWERLVITLARGPRVAERDSLASLAQLYWAGRTMGLIKLLIPYACRNHILCVLCPLHACRNQIFCCKEHVGRCTQQYHSSQNGEGQTLLAVKVKHSTNLHHHD